MGSNNRAELRSVFGDQEMKDLPRLQRGQFWMRWGQDGEPQRLQVRSDLADDRHAMSAAAWEGLAARMVAETTTGRQKASCRPLRQLWQCRQPRRRPAPIA